MSLMLFWCHCCQLHTCFTSCPGVCSVPIVGLEQAKSQLGSFCSKNHDVTILLFVRNVELIIIRGELRTCGTCKLGFFCKISLQLKVVSNFDKKILFKIY